MPVMGALRGKANQAHEPWEPLLFWALREFTSDWSLHRAEVWLRQSMAGRPDLLWMLLPAIIPLLSPPLVTTNCWSRAEEMLGSDKWQGQQVEFRAWGTEIRTDRSQQEPWWLSKAISGLLVNRNRVRWVQGKQMMLFLRQQMWIPSVCSFLPQQLDLILIPISHHYCSELLHI